MRRDLLILGDIVAIALVTFIGFASHGEADVGFIPRMAAAFFPLVLSWFLLSPGMALFQQEIVQDPRQLWRPVLTALFAGPLAAVVRGFLLTAPVIPVFAAVLAATTALGMLVWRLIWSWVTKRRTAEVPEDRLTK